jgi:glycolate oxidase
MEGWDPQRLEEDVVALAGHLTRCGAIDAYILPAGAGRALIEGREKLFWVAKRAGVHDLVDIVVPRASICDFMTAVARIASVRSASINGCGHVGDGNIHLSIFKEDPDERARVLDDLFRAGLALGGAISGEHGIGTLKKEYFQDLEDPAKLDLLRRIKLAFDPNGILNPGVIFDSPVLTGLPAITR